MEETGSETPIIILDAFYRWLASPFLFFFYVFEALGTLLRHQAGMQDAGWQSSW